MTWINKLKEKRLLGYIFKEVILPAHYLIQPASQTRNDKKFIIFFIQSAIKLTPPFLKIGGLSNILH